MFRSENKPIYLEATTAGKRKKFGTNIAAMAEFGHSKAAADVVSFGKLQPLVVVALGAQVLNRTSPQVDVHTQFDRQRVIKGAERFKKGGSFQLILHGGVRQPALKHTLTTEKQNAL